VSATGTIDEGKSFIRWLGLRDIAVYLLLLILSLVLENAGLGLLIPLINALESGSNPQMSFGPVSIEGELSSLIALVMFIVALRAGLTVVSVWFGSQLTNSWNERMRVHLHDALHNPLIEEPHSIKSGELINTILGETWSASEYCRMQLDLVSRGLALAAYGAVLIWLSWKMTAILVLAALPLAFVAWRLNRRTRKISRTILDLNNDLYQATVGSVGAQFTIAVYGLERRFRSIFAEKSAWMRTQQVKANVYGSLVPQLLSVIVIPVIVGLGLYSRSRSMPVGEIVVYVLVMYRALPQATGVLSSLNELARHRAGFETVTQRMKSWVAPVNNKSQETLTGIEQIEFKQISFAYDASAPMIKDFSAELTAGNSYQLHGASGAGKSTLVSMILGLLTPDSGAIDVNGIPLGDIDLAGLRRHVGYAGQRTSVFEVSIDENIDLWRQLTSDRLRAVEAALGVDDVLSNLPDGGSTRIGTGGVTISGGQQQRVEIARAIAAAPALIILDEATSELDLNAEQRVMTAVRELCPASILLTISHRVETIHDGSKLTLEHRT